MIIAGLDIETTGLDMNKGHRLIQIGISFGVLDNKCWDVQPMGTMTVDPEAMAINKFTMDRIAAATPNDEIDPIIAQWLVDRGIEKNSIYIVGWNVGWDREFVKKELPETAKFIYRPIDLTGITIADEIRKGHNPDAWRTLGKLDTQIAVTDILGKSNFHDAGFDATAALLAFRLLTRRTS